MSCWRGLFLSRPARRWRAYRPRSFACSRSDGWSRGIRGHSLEAFSLALWDNFSYAQVPAIGAGERGCLDLLTLDRGGRLAVIEIKADEDMHLPLQGLDYWIRVRQL